MTIFILKATQVFDDNLVQVPALEQDEAPTKILPKYADFFDVFSYNLAMEPPENTGINNMPPNQKKRKNGPMDQSIAQVQQSWRV